MNSKEAKLLMRVKAEAWRPDPSLAVSEWADQRRVLSAKASAEHGNWRTSRTPYLREPMDRFSVRCPTQEIVMVFASQTGKALAVETPIATPDGWSTMGELQVGDRVFDEAGRPTKVVATSPVMTGRDCYRVRFSDGAEIVADGEHLWTVDDETTGSSRAARRTLRTIDMLNRGVKVKGRNAYAIPVAGPLRLAHAADLPIHPYALGAWLGDGNSASAQFTQHVADTPELAENLRRCGERVTVRNVSATVCNLAIDLGDAAGVRGRCRRGHDPAVAGVMEVMYPDGKIRQRCAECNRQSAMASKYGKARDPILPAELRFGERLKALGVLGSGAKRIPAQYQRASVKQRLELLRGLMDTDGTIDKRGRLEIGLTAPGLAADVMELLHGLGLKPTTRITSTGSNRMAFSAYLPRSLFRLERKRRRMKGPTGCRVTEARRRRIVEIVPTEPVPVRCIKVAAASSLFLSGRGMVPTHNSEALNNCAGYAVDIAPGPLLMIQPTIDLAKRYSKMRVGPMIEATPTLAAKVKPSRSRDSGNTILMKEFLNEALLIMGGANAASGLASMPIRYLLMDEIDRFPIDVDEEGSPMALAEVRTRTFGARRKILSTSTPTLVNRSAIWAKWEQSNQCHYEVPCPHCGHYQVLRWNMMRYDPKDRLLPSGSLSQPPVIICENCGEGIEERAKSKWYGQDLGRWVATNPESTIYGYHLSGLYSPLGWLSWPEIVIGYERSKEDPVRLKVWTNTVLAECYAETGEVPDWEALYRRRESYQRGTVPAGGLVLTAAADVQRDRIEVEVVAWGPGMESWSVDYIVLQGDTSTIQTDPLKPCPWRNLTAELQRVYKHESGSEISLSRFAVDSGDQTQVVYAWARAQSDPRVMAIKGRGGLASAVGTPTTQEVNFKGRKLKRGIKLWPLGVDILKTELYGWLRQDPPLNAGDPPPRGFCHWPEYGEGYFQMLTAEELRPKLRRGFTVYQWEKIRDRNEALDVRCYARAAATTLGIDRWTEEEWQRRREALGMTAAAQAQEPAPAPADEPAPAPVRRKRKPRRVATMRGL